MKNAIKFALLATVGFSAFAVPAYAQDGQEAQETDEEFAEGEIVVTATRRAERLQDVPLAVSAISGDQLAEGGFQSLTDIQYQFSGVQFGTSPNDAGFRLRGVGTAGGFSSSSEQNVGTVVDNVVIPFGNPVASLGDLERVEVLKGPQGTQFGKNASSGVVNITTKRPELGVVGGKAFASYAELGETNINGQINLPLGDTIALGLYAFHRKHDGYIENVVRDEKWGGNKNYGVRAKLLMEPTDNFSVMIIGDWSKVKRKGPGQTWTLNRLPSFANPLMAARFGNLTALGITPGFDNTKSAEEYPGFSSETNYGASVEINVGLGNYDLTSVTALRKLNEGPQNFAIDGSSVPVFTAQPTGVDQSFLSEELRISSPKGSVLEFTGGIYLSRRTNGDENDFNRAQLRPAAPFNPFIVNISAGQSNAQTKSESAAVFFDGSLKVTNTIRVIGGLRYQKDWVESSSYSIIDPAFAPAPPGPPQPGVVVFYTARPLATGSTKKGDWSGRFGFEFKPNDDLLFFGTIARGYLGPTVTFSGLTGQRVEVSPQTVRDITVGMKSQFFDRQVTLNANVFFDNYKNLQTSVFNGLEFLTENAGGFKAQGFEIDTSWRVSDHFSLNASYTYSDTKFTDYITACPSSVTVLGAAAIAATCNAPGSVPATPLFQAKGEPLSGAPKHSATFGADFNHDINDALAFDASANFYYRSRVDYAVANPFQSQSGYGTIGVTAGIGDTEGKWHVGLFARNLLDERFHAAVIGLPFADAGGYVNWMTREGRRTVGVSAEMRF